MWLRKMRLSRITRFVLWMILQWCVILPSTCWRNYLHNLLHTMPSPHPLNVPLSTWLHLLKVRFYNIWAKVRLQKRVTSFYKEVDHFTVCFLSVLSTDQHMHTNILWESVLSLDAAKSWQETLHLSLSPGPMHVRYDIWRWCIKRVDDLSADISCVSFCM